MSIKRVQVPIWHAKFLYMNLQNNFIIAIIVGIMVVQEEEVNEWMSGCGMQLTGVAANYLARYSIINICEIKGNSMAWKW